MVDWNSPSTLTTAIEAAGMNIRDFAVHAGVSRSQLYRLVSGKFKPSYRTQESIERALTIALDAREAA